MSMDFNNNSNYYHWSYSYYCSNCTFIKEKKENKYNNNKHFDNEHFYNNKKRYKIIKNKNVDNFVLYNSKY